ncbi:MAG: hypothetical protein K8R25_16500 [Methanosarcinales archaeon]|nr:hypothetical protein [Methanosarcinales archaeon]
MKKNIQITAILMALAIFGLCALIAPVCADSEATDAEEVVAEDEGNASNESEAADADADSEAADADADSEAADAVADSVAVDADADSEAAVADNDSEDAEPSPGFGIVAVMISMAVLFLLIRKNE